MSKYNWKFEEDAMEEDENDDTNEYSVKYEPGVYGYITDEGSSGTAWRAQSQNQEWGTEREPKLKSYDEAVKIVDEAYEKYKNSK